MPASRQGRQAAQCGDAGQGASGGSVAAASTSVPGVSASGRIHNRRALVGEYWLTAK